MALDLHLRNWARRGDFVSKALKALDAKLSPALDLPAWTDLQGSVSEGAGPAALTYEGFRDTGFKMYFMRYNQADELNFVFQMMHEWNPTTVVKPHMHVIPMADPLAQQTVSMKILYTWSRVGIQLPALSGWSSRTVTLVVNPGDVYYEKIISIGDITPPVGAVESDILLIQAVRDIANDSYETVKDHGTAAANLAVISVDVHFQQAKLGTATPTPRG